MLRNTVKLCLIFSLTISLSGSVLADELQEISNALASSPDQLSKGKSIYDGACSSCHGPSGRGDGPASAAFNPKPRNFVEEQFKQGASPSAAYFTISNGLGSMPSFSSLPVADRMAVVHYVLSLSSKKEADSPESLAKIGLDPSGKPLAGFKSEKAQELPVEFIIERMASDGNTDSLDYKAIQQQFEESKKAQAAAAAPVVLTPDLKRGKDLFESCQICHGKSGEGTKLAGAPQIAGQDFDYLVTQLKNFQIGARGAHADDVNGLKMRPMSRLLQTEADVVSTAKFISELPPQKPVHDMGQGDASKGQAAYGTCMACHGADAKGSKAMKAPALVTLQDWYIAEQIKKFKSGVRGSDARDTGGASMRGMAMAVVDEQAVKDLVAYISTLNK